MSLTLAAKHAALDAHNAQTLIRIARETETDDTPIKTTSHVTLGGDERRLRGIPAIGRGVSGAIPGTAPGGRTTSLAPRHRDPIEDTGWQ